jgi:GT2 family glycosyltransferase
MFPRLPQPPSLDVVERNITRIDPVSDSGPRPFWSVMIPTYNRPDYLRKTLESVLVQDPGPEQMQIQILDNGSDSADISALVKTIAGDRVEYFRQPINVGQENFTACIRRSRGRWVQMLHDDDLVMPGFYQQYRDIIEQDPELVMVFGQVVQIDEVDQPNGIVSGPMPPACGPRVEDFVQRQAFGGLVYCVSAVVRRDAYEKAGAFCKSFQFLSDSELWFRIGQVGPVAMVPRPLAWYRVHQSSGTNLLLQTAHNVLEQYQLFQVNSLRTGLQPPEVNGVSWRSAMAQMAENTAWRLDSRGLTLGRLNQARVAWLLDPSLRRYVFFVKSWLKHKLVRFLPAAPAASPAVATAGSNQ